MRDDCSKACNNTYLCAGARSTDRRNRRMENAVVKKRNDIGWAIIIASVMILFTCGFLTGLVGADYPMHEEIAMDLHPRQPIAMFKAHPEPLWHLMVYTLVRFLHFEVEIAGAAVSGFLVVVTYLIAYFAIRKTVPGLQSYEAAGLDLVLHLCSAIYVPFFNIKPYLGQGTPNIWHNPTTICVRPIALLTLLLVALAAGVVSCGKDDPAPVTPQKPEEKPERPSKVVVNS